VPARQDQAVALRALQARLQSAAQRSLRHARDGVSAEGRALAHLHPAAVLSDERERVGLLLDRARVAVEARVRRADGTLERAGDRLPVAARGRLVRASTSLHAAHASLSALGPYATLERGYAIVRAADGTLLRDAATVHAGALVDVRLARGGLDARVEHVRDSPA
jgi:exodeoxyribonuclease VII large subunit